MNQKQKQKRLNLEIPEELHNKVKHEAIHINVTLRKWVIRAIIEKIQREEIYRK